MKPLRKIEAFFISLTNLWKGHGDSMKNRCGFVRTFYRRRYMIRQRSFGMFFFVLFVLIGEEERERFALFLTLLLSTVELIFRI